MRFRTETLHRVGPLILLAGTAPLFLYLSCPEARVADERQSAASAPAAATPAGVPAIGPGEKVEKSDLQQIRFLLVGAHHGELEPCGCSGGQLGGLGRMKSKLEGIVQTDPATIVLDAGELIKIHSPQGMAALKKPAAAAFEKMESVRGEVAASIFQELPISAIGLGPRDLSAGLDEAALRAMLMKAPVDEARYPTVSRANVITNVTYPKADGALVPSARIAAPVAGGSTANVLVLCVVDQEGGAFGNPTAALNAELRRQAGKYQFVAVIFHGPRDRARAYAAAHPAVDLWLVAMGSGAPDAQAEAAGGGILVHAGDRGRNVVALFASRKGGKIAVEKYDSLAVAANDPNDGPTQEKIDSYRTRLGAENLIEVLKSQRPVDAKMRAYAGSDRCGECHKSAFEVWKSSKHAHAMEDERFVKRSGANDPECIQCHVTGWHSEPPTGELTSYRGEGANSKFGRVTCESCHGPSLRHADQPQIAKPPRDVTCEKCHDPDNSPAFDRAKYWPKIAHKLDPK
jgi:hypothetical protein